MTKLLLVFISIFFVSGCCSTNSVRTIEDHDGKPQLFRGIVDVIQQAGDTNIIFIHGMGGYSMNDGQIDPCSVINDLRHAVGLKPVTFDAPKWYCNDDFTLGENAVHMRSMFWSDITFYRKDRLQSIDELPLFENNRAGVTKLVKQDFINSGFSDAIMYTGVYRDKIINKVIESFEYLNGKSAHAKTIIVTFSLGSAVMLDSLRKLETIKKTGLLSNKVEMIYMMANQIPLIQTGTLPLEENRRSQGFEQLKTYVSNRNVRSNRDKIRIIAFSDPNDLLSYPLDGEDMGSFKDQYVNVAISVTKYTYYVPFLKKYSFVNYMKAHTGYVYDKGIKALLFHGNH